MRPAASRTRTAALPTSGDRWSVKVSGQTVTTRSLGRVTALPPRRLPAHRLNVSPASTGIVRSGAMPASRFARAASGRTRASAFSTPANGAASHSHCGSRPIA